jgi:hypothetical protein
MRPFARQPLMFAMTATCCRQLALPLGGCGSG